MTRAPSDSFGSAACVTMIVPPTFTRWHPLEDGEVEIGETAWDLETGAVHERIDAVEALGSVHRPRTRPTSVMSTFKSGKRASGDVWRS